MIQAEDHLRAGRLSDALAALTAEVRKKPANGDLRVFLFQLFAVLGQWERARNQLDVLADLKPEARVMVQTYRRLITCEGQREAVFSGQQSPVVFGEPPAWMAALIQALRLGASGELAAAAELRGEAFDAAPATPGTIDEQPFAWLADSDSRLGPVLEAVVDGQYFWVPMERIRAIQIEPPSQLRDMVWLPAYLTWENAGQSVAMLPVRYPGTTACDDDQLRLARKTEWVEAEGDLITGLGQRVLATDQQDYPLLDIRHIAIPGTIEEDASG